MSAPAHTHTHTHTHNTEVFWRHSSTGWLYQVLCDCYIV